MQPVPQPHPEPEHKPKIWIGIKVLKDQTAQPDPIPKEDYCNVCYPCRRIGPHTWQIFSTHMDWEESEEEEKEQEDRESDWDADIEDAID